jgi:UDP-N-acetylglucosamine 2-epimerase (non-hydrolysing)
VSTGTALWAAQALVGELPVGERDPMTLFNPAASGGDGPVHDVLLIAGSRAEAARLAPIVTAMTAAGRIEPVPVAAGPDPMRVHDALEGMGVPAAVTLLLGEPPHSQVAAAAALAVRLDELMVDRDPSAVLLSGGGITAVIAAQVAFWRQIPVVYLEHGADVEDQSCPFPEGGNRRVISQLTSLFLRSGRQTSQTIPNGGPNTIVVGDTMAASRLSDRKLAGLAERARKGKVRIALLDAAADSVVAATPGLLASHSDVEVVFVGLPADADLVGHRRVSVLAHSALPDVVGMLAVSTLGVTDRHYAEREGLDFGLPTLLVERTGRPDLATGTVAADPAAVLTAMAQLLAGYPNGRCRYADPAAAGRAEHALAWMFGLEADPMPTPVAGAAGQSGASAPGAEE